VPIFERYLTVWVGLCIIAGVVLGNFSPQAFALIASIEYAHVNLVVAIFIWIMIDPMMVQIDFSAIKDVGRRPKGLALTLIVNWLIKPFSMAALGWLFFRVFFADLVDPQEATEYIAGMILLGVAPCTAMVFVWSQLTKGDPNYTLVQVSVNDVIMVFAFAPARLVHADTEALVDTGPAGDRRTAVRISGREDRRPALHHRADCGSVTDSDLRDLLYRVFRSEGVEVDPQYCCPCLSDRYVELFRAGGRRGDFAFWPQFRCCACDGCGRSGGSAGNAIACLFREPDTALVWIGSRWSGLSTRSGLCGLRLLSVRIRTNLLASLVE
jgi:hypothetical protein